MKIEDPVARAAAIDKLEEESTAKLPPATLADVVAQIDHAVKIGGIDHVGIGTDFDGVGCVPAELSSYDKFPALTRALLEKGYSATDIKKIYGGQSSSRHARSGAASARVEVDSADRNQVHQVDSRGTLIT